jgi:hypothetical protein
MMVLESDITNPGRYAPFIKGFTPFCFQLLYICFRETRYPWLVGTGHTAARLSVGSMKDCVKLSKFYMQRGQV